MGWQILMSIFFDMQDSDLLTSLQNGVFRYGFFGNHCLCPSSHPSYPGACTTQILSSSRRAAKLSLIRHWTRQEDPPARFALFNHPCISLFLKFSFPLQIVDWFDLLAASVKTQYNLPSYDIVWDVSLSESDLILEAVQSGLADAACGR